MQNIVEVRNIRIGEGIPKICIPLAEETKEEFLKSAEALLKIKFDIAEIRIDYFNNVENLESVKDLLKDLRNILKNIPILFTFRTLEEGGKRDISLEYYKILNIEIAKTKSADLIDIELFTGDEIVKEIIKKIHSTGTKVVISSHNFNETPEKDKMIKIFCRMEELGADISKIAVMGKSADDVLKLLWAGNYMAEHGKNPIIAVSMGKQGVISRIGGEFFGSAVTFGSLNKSSAPGQISADKLGYILDILHNIKEG